MFDFFKMVWVAISGAGSDVFMSVVCVVVTFLLGFVSFKLSKIVKFLVVLANALKDGKITKDEITSIVKLLKEILEDKKAKDKTIDP